jgi:hypothetical protein
MRHPVAERFIDRVLERARSALDDADIGTEEAHTQDVRLLATHIFRSHVNDAIEAEQRTYRGGGNAMLPGSGFGDDATLSHARGEQSLAECVVELVRACVEQVFALEENACSARMLRQALGKIKRRGRPQ